MKAQILKALDMIAIALTNTGHNWTKEERAAYNEATRFLIS